MKENYLYRQVHDRVIIEAVTFDYHAIGDKYKLTQKKKIPSIRLAKKFCKELIARRREFNLVISECFNGHVKTKFQP